MSFQEHNNNGVIYMTADNIQATHLFTTRFGGVSRGIYSSLNLGMKCGDDPELVRENYGRVCRILGVDENDIVCSNQVHGAYIRTVTHEDCGELFILTHNEADGLITQAKKVALMIFTADCVPILLHDPTRNVIGAVHAGWRGTALNISGAAIIKMVDEFGCNPKNISAAIGPCISKCCFETGQDTMDAICATLGEKAKYCITAYGEKYMIDLKQSNQILLIKAGLQNITVSDECTSCQSDKYWSHRKTNGLRGSQVSIITM